MPRKITRAKTKALKDGGAAERKAAFVAYRKQWLSEHPGRKARDFDLRKPDVLAWHRAKCRTADKAMRRAWLKEHPGDPLPEHLCALDNPFPGQKRWCAAAIRWLSAYSERMGFFG